MDISSTVEATNALLREENLAMLERNKVLTRGECHSRHEILLENYIKTTRISALTLLEMTRRSILPASCLWLSELANAKSNVETANASNVYINEATFSLSATIDACAQAADLMEKVLLKSEEIEDTKQAGQVALSLACNEMNTLRLCCDKLETLLPDSRWPFPSYTSLLYDL